jgi:serine/threonine protein kinase
VKVFQPIAEDNASAGGVAQNPLAGLSPPTDTSRPAARGRAVTNMSGLEPGFQLGHYRITRSLGSGGMADVYEAHDDNLERTVALKVLPIEYCRNPQLVARFAKEVRAAAKLNHRNIVTVYEVGHQDSYHYFSMRLLTGGDLRRRIEQGLSPMESLAILRELADAFAHAHARNFVHRDVKPENVMFDEQGFPVLTDFGIAKALDANTHMTRTGMTMGTPRYLSPEQASGKPVDARADLYSLGVMFFEMLTGKPPYDAEESMAVIFKHVTEPIPVLPPEVLRYQPLLEKLMAKDPAKRVPSAVDLIREIDAIVPRQPTGEVRQSQLRTAENPLIAGLLTPSPLRTPAPQTPRPVTPAPLTPAPATPVVRDMTGEVAVQVAPAVTRKPAPAAPSQLATVMRPAPAAPPAAAAATPTPAAARGLGGVVGAIAMVGGIAIAGYTSWQALRPEADKPAAEATTAPAPAVDPQIEAQRAEQARQEQLRRDAARKQAAETEARSKTDAEARQKAEAQARQRAEQDAAAKKAAAEQQANHQPDAEARRRAQADAEARRRAEAEAEARRRAEAEEAARRKAAESQAAPTLSAEEIERRAREADRQKAAARAKQEPEKPRKREEPKPVQKEEKSAEDDEALERARSAPGF